MVYEQPLILQSRFQDDSAFSNSGFFHREILRLIHPLVTTWISTGKLHQNSAGKKLPGLNRTWKTFGRLWLKSEAVFCIYDWM